MTSPNLISNTNIKLSNLEQCHHSLIYGVIYLKVPFPPPQLTEVWYYKNAYSSYMQDLSVLIERSRFELTKSLIY